MAKSNHWDASQSLHQKECSGWNNIWDESQIVAEGDGSFDYNIQLKVHATKTYSNGTPVGFSVSTDKKSRIYQHIDSAGQTKFQKEAWGVLLITPEAAKVEYKTVGDIPLDAWMVLRRDAHITEDILQLESTQKIDEIAFQLQNNTNIKVIKKNFKIPGILDKPGEVG